MLEAIAEISDDLSRVVIINRSQEMYFLVVIQKHDDGSNGWVIMSPGDSMELSMDVPKFFNFCPMIGVIEEVTDLLPVKFVPFGTLKSHV